ncbi:ADP-forming succinate--CoA ligase subunit beta [bacterium]|nr:ADP-forming succinate--CoA ligase subunit beta [bacterium]
MKLQEYQAKDIMESAGIPVKPGKVATTPQEAVAIYREMGGQVVVKSQVLVGGRGKAGGIKLATNETEVREKASAILGMDIKGITVKKVLIAPAVNIAAETYIGIVIDRKTQSPVIMVSPAGGIDIEEVAKKTPEKIFMTAINPFLGVLPYQARALASKLFQDPAQIKKTARVITLLYQVFVDNDASLAEINPFCADDTGELWAVDAKILLDDNGLVKHPQNESLRNLDEEIPEEVEARNSGLSFVKLDGNIGCMVNGAGLAMATMDIVKYFGGEPANFLDIGGSSSPEKVITAMNIITNDPNVKVIMVNIFGGITRCDDVANGIIEAHNKVGIKVPIVIRLTGTNEEEARKILSDTALIPVGSMSEGAQKAIEIAQTR